MMKKRLFAVLVSLCMIVSMLPAVAFADGSHGDHAGWKTLSGTIEKDDFDLPAGNYVLTGDVTLEVSSWNLGEKGDEDESVVICLNGHEIKGNGCNIKGTSYCKDVTICDCIGSGKIRDAVLSNADLTDITLIGCNVNIINVTASLSNVQMNGGSISAWGKLYINDGCRINCDISVLDELYINGGYIGGNILASAGSSTSIYGGTIDGSISVFGGGDAGVISSPGILNIYGGEINRAITVDGGACNISGEDTIIQGNTNSDYEVGVCVNSGTCNITGGTISISDYTTISGEATGAVVVKDGSCSIGGDARITSCRIDNGGAVSVLGGSCTISGDNIYNNNTRYGGVYVENGTCTIEEGAKIRNNNAFRQGGGVHVAGGVCNIHGDITENKTDNYDGGGVYVARGTCTIDGVVDQNTAVDGGGVYIAAGECNIYGTVTENTATANGGGIYAAGGSCNIYGAVTENKAVAGGGVYVAPGAQVNTRNSTSGYSLINYNSASENGGGVYLGEGAKWENVCNITFNSAQGAGGGIYGIDGCSLTLTRGSISNNFAALGGGGLYLSAPADKPCIVDISRWDISSNYTLTGSSNEISNVVSFNSKITYSDSLTEDNLLPYDEPNSIILQNADTFTIMKGRYKASEISSCFTLSKNSELLIAGGYYDADPSKEPTLTVVDGVKAIELDGDIGHNQYDPNYPWAVYPVKDGIMSGTSNNPVYDGASIEGASIEKDGDFSLSGTTDIQKLYYWHKPKGAEDSSYVAGLPFDAGDYTIKVGGLHSRTIGEEYYTECTFDLTIAKADPSYTVPTGITAQVGKPLSDVTLPEGWKWEDENTIPQTEGTQTYPAIFTPDDTANYNTVETDVSVEVVNGPAVQEYAITFDANGGSVSPSSAQTKNGKLESLPTPTRGGYDFLGWYTEETGGEKVTTDTVFTKNSIIYAHWQEQTAQEYTVTFNANGGSVSTTSTTTKDGKLESLPTPTRGGYDFLGWYTEKDGGEKVTNNTVFTNDTTIYAHWQKQAAQEYTVTFDANGGSVNPSGSSTKDGKLESLPTPTRGGYDFLGWYTEETGGDEVTTDTVFTNDTTIYAHWQKQAAQEFTVTFDANGGTINSGVITSYTYGVGATLPTDVTREGYTFAGWYASADFSGDAVKAISAEDTGNKTYWAKWTANAYGITVTNDGNGDASADKTTAAEGETVTLTATPNSGYHFERWDVITGNVTIDDNTFTMPAESVAIKAIFARNSAVTPPINPPINPPTVSEETTEAIADAQPGETVTVDLSGGDTTLDKEVFETLAGKDVTLVIDLGDDVSWTVKGSDVPEDADFTDIDMGVTMNSDGIPVDVVNAITGEVGTVQITLAHDGAFGFTMTLTAPLGKENAGYWANLYHFDEDANAMTFETAAPIGSDGSVSLSLSHASQYAIVIDDHNHGIVTLPFTDVSEGDWFYDPVCFVYSQGLMTGTSATTFEPNTHLSRAMLVAVLHRLEGSPQASAGDFTDVADGDWYAQAVNWAASVGVVNGFDDGTFQPNAAITREQMAAILRNYAAYKGLDVTAADDLANYSDASSVSDWAKESIQWAVGSGLLGGYEDGTLRPQGTTTRAEVASVLQRALGNVAGNQ